MIGKVRPPYGVSKIISQLNANGHEAYLVGGCVRDSIMNKAPVDWDITTSADPQRVKCLFRRTYDTGIAHGTVTVAINSGSFEVTTFRIDGKYLDGRRPERVEFTCSLRDDLMRRDFTMNAIAWHMDQGYIDPFEGIADIKARLVRGVGDAGQRFREDALRMLRAIRFAAQLNFEIEPITWEALIQNACLINKISMERVRDELLKLLISGNPEKIALLSDSGLMEYIDPALAGHLKAFDPVSLLSIVPDVNLRFIMLLRGLDGQKNRLKYFKLDNKTINLISTLQNELETALADDFTHIRQRLAKIGPRVFKSLTLLFEAYGEDMSGILSKLEVILTEGHCISLSTLAVGGDDLKEAGITDGRAIGQALNTLFNHVLENPEDNKRDTLVQIAKEL